MQRLYYSLTFILIFTFISFAQTYERAKIWDKEIDYFADIDRRQNPPKDGILFVGSSSIRGWYNLRQSFPKLNVINRGFGGSRLEDVNYYFDKIVTPYNSKIVVLYAGENDVNEGIAPETVLESFRKFSTMFRAKFPKSKLIFVSIKPSPSRWKIADKFKQANNLIKTEIAKDKRAVFVDVWSTMLGTNGEPLPEIFKGDKLHLNEKGYEIWRKVLEKHLK